MLPFLLATEIGLTDGPGVDDVFWIAGGLLTICLLLAFVIGKVIWPMWNKAKAFFAEQDAVIEAAKRMSEFLDWHDTRFRPDWDGVPGDAGHIRIPGVMERLNRIDGEFKRDGNGSLKSQVSKMDETLSEVKATVDSMVSPTVGGEDNRINTDGGNS